MVHIEFKYSIIIVQETNVIIVSMSQSLLNNLLLVFNRKNSSLKLILKVIYLILWENNQKHLIHSLKKLKSTINNKLKSPLKN